MDDLDPNRDDIEEVAMEIDETGDFRQGNKNARIQVSIIISDLDMGIHAITCGLKSVRFTKILSEI